MSIDVYSDSDEEIQIRRERVILVQIFGRREHESRQCIVYVVFDAAVIGFPCERVHLTLGCGFGDSLQQPLRGKLEIPQREPKSRSSEIQSRISRPCRLGVQEEPGTFRVEVRLRRWSDRRAMSGQTRPSLGLELEERRVVYAAKQHAQI